MGLSLLSASEKTDYDNALASVFDTFARPFSLYLNAQVATVSTSPTYSRFGDHSQQAPVSTDNPAFTPVVYTVTGCILYGNKQPWEYIEPARRADYQQNKIRESMGTVRIKVDATGHALLSQSKALRLDGFDFTLVSSPRPHGLVGSPVRWSYTYQLTD